MISLIFQLLLLIRVFRPSEEDCSVFKKESKLSCKDINVLLDYHNECRDLVATGKTKLPAGKDIWVLKWDDDLAKLAQNYANKCIFEHNKLRPKGTGENLAWHCDSRKIMSDVKHLSKMWYDEIDLYDPTSESVLQPGAGHLTQMIWGDTKFVGCGIAFYVDGTHQRTPYQTLLVCNYKPSGNVRTLPLYAKLEKEQAVCERGVQSVKYTGLCAHDQDHANGKYSPCSGFRLQPTIFIFIVFLLLGCYLYAF